MVEKTCESARIRLKSTHVLKTGTKNGAVDGVIKLRLLQTQLALGWGRGGGVKKIKLNA